jgi:SNF2 family DNA or RNA helicase
MSQLDPVQLAALKFAEGKPGVGWFMEQGLGKTLTALTEFERLYHDNRIDRAIVICPNTFKQGWADEITKHGFNFHVHVFRSAKREEATEFCRRIYDDKPSLMIVNYEAARIKTVIAGLIKWAGRGRTYLVIDESIQIKSPPTKSQQTKAVHALAAWSPFTGESMVCRYVRILTGKPSVQGPHDLWGQLRAIGLFRETNFYSFRGAFCVMGGWENKEVIRAKNTEALARTMEHNIFQAKKKDWLPNLPRKDQTIRDYKMSPAQQAQYNQMEKQFLLEVESGVITVEVAIAKYAKLAQIQTGFIYDEERIVHELVAPEENPRLNLLKQLLEEEVEGKCCVVYRHRAILPVLIKALAEYDPAWIKGQMKPEEVEEQKSRFNNDPHCRVIFLQCDASKYGHTLCLQPEEDKCRTMVFFENSYSLDTRSQVEDRIHRRGQTGEYVLYIDLSGSDFDRRVIKALQRKENLHQAVFSKLRKAEPAPA